MMPFRVRRGGIGCARPNCAAAAHADVRDRVLRPNGGRSQHPIWRLAGVPRRRTVILMCRNIRPLNNFEPPATRDEVTAAALQYVRKVSGTTKPSQANQAAFDAAVAKVAHITEHLLDDWVTAAPPKNREVEAEKARARAAVRYAR